MDYEPIYLESTPEVIALLELVVQINSRHQTDDNQESN